ncbi:MAG TPA: sugar transferase [Ktedonobacterales bacterium]|nr:sugar transferase [Ktedonobacterales bacterium]
MVAVTAPARPEIPFSARYLRAKRVLDVVGAVLLLIPLSLVMALVAAAIKLDSPGPILFRQKRVGLDGAEFEMLKFRSMIANNDDSVHRDAIKRFMDGQALDESSTTSRYKLSADRRITRVGRFIRKTSLDELPQFINVLRGEMSLVGPRPPLAYEVALYKPSDMRRLAGKPGVTGTWQVYGRSRVTFDEMIEMDVAYLQRQSLLEDLKLIVLTVPAVLHGGG